MKKISLLLILSVVAVFTASAQYWQIPNVNANTNPGGLNTALEEPSTAAAPWVTLMSTAATPTWSAATNLPFAFMFNGSAVTQFMASSTGVVTFDVATALTAPSTANGALPNAAIPDQSVCVWGITGTGANDKIIYNTFGVAPNRQFWISYNSYSHPSNATIFSYWSIVLDETTNYIHIVDQRTSSSTGAVTIGLTAGLQVNSTTAYSVATSPALNSTTGSTGGTLDTPADNSFYTFVPGIQPAIDIKLVDVTPHDGTTASYIVAPGSVTLNATIVNYGSTAITGFTFTYDDGSGPVNQVLSGLNIAPFATHTWAVTPSYNLATAVHKNLACSVSLAGDANTANDNFATGVTGATFLPVHNVTFEEGTGTWCGWCVRGMVYMDSVHVAHPDAVLVAVHNADPMTVTAYDAGVGTFISGYPSVIIDRKEVDDPSNIFNQYTKHKPDFGFADMTLTNTVTGNVVSAQVNCHFAVDLTGSYRLALVVTQDNVHDASGGSWDQHNYYSSTSQNLPLTGAGFNFQLEANPIPSAKMYYDFVAVAIDNTFTGRSGTITSPITAGANQSYTFSYTLPAGADATNMHTAALLIDQNSGMILNATQKVISTASGVATVSSKNIEATLYPNPTTDKLNVALELTSTQAVNIAIINMIGEQVAVSNTTLKNGTVTLNMANLAAGNYLVKITTGNETVTQKIVKE